MEVFMSQCFNVINITDIGVMQGVSVNSVNKNAFYKMESHSIDYICTKCRYVLKNGSIAAREICPKSEGGCGALNSFVPFEWHH